MVMIIKINTVQIKTSENPNWPVQYLSELINRSAKQQTLPLITQAWKKKNLIQCDAVFEEPLNLNSSCVFMIMTSIVTGATGVVHEAYNPTDSKCRRPDSLDTLQSTLDSEGTPGRVQGVARYTGILEVCVCGRVCARACVCVCAWCVRVSLCVSVSGVFVWVSMFLLVCLCVCVSVCPVWRNEKLDMNDMLVTQEGREGMACRLDFLDKHFAYHSWKTNETYDVKTKFPADLSIRDIYSCAT